MATSTASNLSDTSEKKAQAAATGDYATPIVLDFGRQRRKAVKALRKGEGKLMAEVSATLDELRASGAVANGAQPIIIVVRQKRRRTRGLMPRF